MKKAPPPDGLLQAARETLACHTETGWQRYHCKLVTPMYGGGTKAGVVDEKMPVRATAIRGQLRYWWRLLNRGKYPDSQKLFEAERAIWGGLGDAETLAASRVALRVENLGQPTLEACADFKLRDDGRYRSMPDWRDWAKPYSYALFPAQGQLSRNKQSIETPPATLIREGLTWDLCINMAKLSPDQSISVEQALRWWATFGGIGARTRRGLGAVEVKEMDADRILRVSEEEIAAQNEFVLRLRPPAQNAMRAWEQALTALRDFRQGEDVGRNKMRGGRPGRSRWPEPAAIRKITGQHRVKKDGTAFAPGEAPLLFPRAAFGLPIIFHFQGEGEDKQPDPGDSELAPIFGNQKRERMASPLILRPYPNQNGKWHPAVLCLPQDHIREMELQLNNTGAGRNRNLPKRLTQGAWWPSDPNAAAKVAAGIRPMSDRGTDALTAFIAFFVSPSTKSNHAVGNQSANTVEAAQEERWEKAQIKFNQGNGSITVVGPNNRNVIALGDAGRAIWASLSPQAQQKIRSGFFRTAVLVKGNEIIKIEEKS